MSFFSKKQDNDMFFIIDNDISKAEDGSENGTALHSPSYSLTPDEVKETPLSGFENPGRNSALQSLKRRMQVTASGESTDDVAETAETAGEADSNLTAVSVATAQQPPKDENRSDKQNTKTMLERCKPFILDDDGNDPSVYTPPTYKLESVAEILKSESLRTLDKLSEKYDISFDDLGKYSVGENNVKPAHTAEAVAEKIPETEPFEKEIFEEELSFGSQYKDLHTEIAKVISDIDSSADTEMPLPDPASDESTATIKFTPVSDSDSPTPRISISSQTRQLDLTGELTELSTEKSDKSDEETQLEQSEFEEYTPADEFASEADAKRIAISLSRKKKKSFLSSALSVVFTLLIGFMKLPFMSGIILAYTKPCMIICSSLAGIIVLLNIDMFKSLTGIFGKKSNSDVSASISAVFVMVYAVFGIIHNEIILDLLLLLCFILSVRAVCRFFKDSYMLSNFRQIAVQHSKNGIKLISDPAVTFAMAKNSIEGDTLVAAPQNTGHIEDYMKFSTFGRFLGGKLPSVTFISLALSVITGLACASYFGGIIPGFYSAAAVQCLTAVPIIFMIDSLPLYSASKKLNRLGAMIAGKTGAEHIERANAVVFSSWDIFPSGTVTLHQMKVLSENSIDDTLIRAASLTDCLGSTLAPILKNIAGTGKITSLPNSDTVKYEDRMGISGWVDDKLLFVGNRTLMEAHGIEVPSVEVDRKILRQGFFPVYVASEDRACALLIIQYSVKPQIAHELRKISALGITLLINNSDPNLTEEMICDYMGLYADSVKIMSAAGCHMYKNTVTQTASCSAAAAYRGNPLGLASIITCANKIKKANILLTVLYIISAIIGVILFAYSSFDGSDSPITGNTMLIYGIACTAISYILYLAEKP